MQSGSARAIAIYPPGTDKSGLKARTDEAVRWFEKARSAYAAVHYILASLAAGYALKGETGRAGVALSEARRLSDRYSSIARLKQRPEQDGCKRRSSALWPRPPCSPASGWPECRKNEHRPERRALLTDGLQQPLFQNIAR